MRGGASGSSAAWFMSTPMRRIRSRCCARAASGRAAAIPPSSVTKSRRLSRSVEAAMATSFTLSTYFSMNAARSSCSGAWLLRAGQGELKYGAARFVDAGPEPAAMGIDDGSADGQPHPGAAGLRGVEGLENSLEMFRINARPRIAYSDQDPSLGLLSPDQQFSWPRLDRSHCLDGVEDQIQDDLLHLNAIALNGKQAVREASLDRDAIPDDRTARQCNHLADRLVQ